MSKHTVSETKLKNRSYPSGEEITFVNQFSNMVYGIVEQDYGRFIVIKVKKIQKNNNWMPIVNSYSTTLWKN